jgi:hypothetical protein
MIRSPDSKSVRQELESGIIFSARWGMGLWSAIWEIFKIVGPHAAPHVSQAMKDRRAAREAAESRERQEQEARNAEEVAGVLVALEQRTSRAEAQAAAAKEKASALEQKLAEMQAQFARKWAAARVWMIGLLAWNAVLAVVVIYLVFRKH